MSIFALQSPAGGFLDEDLKTSTPNLSLLLPKKVASATTITILGLNE